MKRFCHECGKEARQEDNVCIHCGTLLKVIEKDVNEEKPIEAKEQVRQEKLAAKEPMPKKQKLMWQIIAGLVVFIIGFSLWANSYYSSENVLKRFEQAVVKEDSNKIKKQISHSDGSSVTKSEAEAFLALVKKEGSHIVLDLAHVTYAGKFLGLYEKYKMESIDQFAAYNNLLEGLSFTFNNKEIEESERDDKFVMYGPLLPGVYDVEALFESDYGDATVEGSVTLSSYMPGDYERIDIDIPIDHVTFYLENYDEIDLEESYIKLNEEKLSISDEGETEEIGPLLIDGSQQAEVVAMMPWGEVISAPIDVDDYYINIYADLITAENYEEILDVIEQLGEEYVEAMAEKSTKPFKSANPEGKEILKSYFSESSEYTGQFDLVEVDKHTMFIDSYDEQPEVKIHTQYHLKEDYHDLKDTPSLYEEVISWIVGLSYDEEDSEWNISSVNSLNSWGGLEVTDERTGSGKLHGPSKEAISNAVENELESNLQEFIFDYTYANVEAINYRDFDLVAKYIDKDGPRYKEADDYIDYLDSKDIYEEWHGSELEKVEVVDDNTWEVTVVEEFDIIRPDSNDVKKFRTTLIIKQIDDEFYVNELTETNETE